ncbi:MAG: hypothetical protein ACYSWQ_02945 [Planctomycetota bacterium]
MSRKIPMWTVIACVLLIFASTGWADVPAPPVNQDIGMPDIAFGGLAEADCRVCHSSGVPDRHHNLYGDPIPSPSLVPEPDADGDTVDDTAYSCLNCHTDLTGGNVERDCLVCHTGGTPHHAAGLTDCTSCHGSVVDDPLSLSHYIPTYPASLVTPTANGGSGSCDVCHDSGTDTGSGYSVLSSMDLHHNTGLGTCLWCHEDVGEEEIRACEECHGCDSLHNIQADSPKLPTGTVVVGGEDAGYGHVGKDDPGGDSDCWGCHGGYTPSALPALSGPLAATVYNVRPAIVRAGINTLVTATGSALTNTVDGVLFGSDVVLTAADGSSVTLTPGVIYEGLLKVTIPGSTAPGNYTLRAVKTDYDGSPVPSNAVAIQIIPEVSITGVTTSDGIVTINGSGFAGYAEGLETSVTGIVKTGIGRIKTATTVEAKIVSWSDTVIKADFGASPEAVTVNSVFGSDTYPN